YTPWPRLHRELSLEMMRFGLKGHIGRIANMLNWRLDVMILSVLAPVEVVGYYAVATKVAEAFRPLSAAFTFVLRPMIASLSVSEARAQGVSLYRRVFALNLLLVVIMAFAGGPIIVRMFGPDFVAAVPAFQILLVGLAALGGAGVLNGYNVGIGRPEFNSYTALAGLVITVIGDVTLIPHYSLIGAAVTSSVAAEVLPGTLRAPEQSRWARLRAKVAGTTWEDTLQDLVDPTRAGWKFLLNLRSNAWVLFLGPSWGAAPVSLARSAAHVVVLDGSVERLRLVHEQAAAAGLENLTFARVVDPLRLPLPDG